MTAGNRWSGSSSHPPPPPPPPAPILPPSSAIDANRLDDQSQRRPHHPPHHRQLESFVDYPPNVPNGTTTTSSPYRSSGNPPGLPSLSSSSSTVPRTGADPGHSSNLPPLDSTNAYPYRRFEDRQQLAPFGLQHVSDVNQGLVTLPSISHTHMSTGGSGESRSPFGSSDALASMSRFSQHGGETFQDQLGRPQQDGASTTYHPQPFPTSDSFHSGGNTLPRTGSSHGNTHIGFSNLLTAERDGIAQFDPRRGGDAAGRGQGQGHQTAQASMHNPSAIGHDTELKRKRSEDDYAETSRARLPTLPGLTMSSLPPPPGFAPMPMQMPRGRSPSPALGSSLSHQPYSHHDQQKQQRQQQNLHHRDATRSGFRLVGDESAEIDQLDMEVDETEAAASETGQNKEDARKEKNRDKQRRLRMRRANQLQSLETTVGTQEVEIKRLSERSHNFEDRTRHTRAIFSDWVDALENRLKELGEPEAAIENLRNQYLGPLNAYNPDYGNTDSTFGGTSMSKSASSSNRISFSKDMSDSASTAPSTDRLASISTRSVLALPINIKGNDQSLSPHAIASLVTPSEYPSRRPQSENPDASRLNYGGLMRNPPWNWNPDIGHSSPHQHSTYPSSSQSKHVTDPSPDSARKGEREDETRSAPHEQRPDGHDGSHEAPAFTTEYLARLQEGEVFEMTEPQINEIARALAEQRPPESKVDLEALGQETIDSAPPWRDDFTSAQILLLGRFLGMGSEQFPEIKARYVEQRLSTLSEHEKEVYKNWTRRKDRDQRIELLPDPVLRIRFIMLQESRSKGSSIIAFLSDLLHEALFFGPIWLTHLCELPESFLRRWSAIWPKDVDATVHCAQFRRRDSITGARAFDIILGSEGPRARKNASEIDLAAFTSDALP